MSKKINNPVLKLLLTILIIIAGAWLLSIKYYRFDLTSEKRYTLSPFTRETLKNLNDEVSVTVYLTGALNIPFYKMKQRLQETLDEFKIYAGKNLTYEFVNPFEGKDSKETDKFLNELVDRGLKPTNILDNDKEGGSSEKVIIPGAIVHYKNVEIPVNLLKNNPGAGAEENINSSIESFEFEFMRVISSLAADSAEKIAFLEGQGEFIKYQVEDITHELGWNFQVDRGNINGTPGILDQYKAVIIAGPTKPFTEKDKFVPYQFMCVGCNKGNVGRTEFHKNAVHYRPQFVISSCEKCTCDTAYK